MGCFNTIMVPCPNCDSQVEFQSKSGDCSLKTYLISSMPVQDLAGIQGDSIECDCCGHVVEITKPDSDPKEVMNFSYFIKS